MNRISNAFNFLKSENKRGFIPFVTAGDPDLATTRKIVVELGNLGATVVELGVPFSDPMADGVVIQRSSERALNNEIGVAEILAAVREIRRDSQVPIILFSYFNPLLQYGLEKLCADAKDCGVDGFLITDLVPEEAEEFSALLRKHDLDMIFLIAPTSGDARLQMVAERASGFIYAVSRTGVTGAQANIAQSAEDLVQRMKQFSDLPVAVGFGISTAAQVKTVQQFADAAVVGSAIVREIENCPENAEVVEKVREFVQKLLA
jgi:tryptophan synthase alpha chain